MLWCHQTWLENLRTEWRFLAQKIIYFILFQWSIFQQTMFHETGDFVDDSFLFNSMAQFPEDFVEAGVWQQRSLPGWASQRSCGSPTWAAVFSNLWLVDVDVDGWILHQGFFLICMDGGLWTSLPRWSGIQYTSIYLCIFAGLFFIQEGGIPNETRIQWLFHGQSMFLWWLVGPPWLDGHLSMCWCLISLGFFLEFEPKYLLDDVFFLEFGLKYLLDDVCS